MKHEPEKWLTDFNRTGYLVVDDCLTPEVLAGLRSAIERITADPDKLPPNIKRHLDFERDYVKEHANYNDLSPEQVGNALRSIRELPLLDPVFADFILYPPLLDILETLFQSPEFQLLNYKCIIKAAKVSSVFRWHRDLPYVQYTDGNVLTAMLCLDDMTEQNGATVMFPGTHRIPEDQIGEQDMDIPEAALPGTSRVTVTCPAGSAVIFHASIIHGGGANRSEKPRRNVIGIWTGPNSYPVNARRCAYQGLSPRTADPARRRQVQMAFPHLTESTRSSRTLPV